MLTAEQMTALKSKVKAEMARRNDGMSLAAYAGEAFDFAAPPQIGQKILAEHGRKTIDLLLNIKDYGDLKLVVQNEPIPDSLSPSLLSYVDSLAKEPINGTASSCRGACTGLCLNSCGNTCSGCSGTCGGCTGCNSTCGSGCANGARA